MEDDFSVRRRSLKKRVLNWAAVCVAGCIAVLGLSITRHLTSYPIYRYKMPSNFVTWHLTPLIADLSSRTLTVHR